MLMLLGVLMALIGLTIVVVIHELGHFLFARAFNVKVRQFGIGLPPKIATLFTDKKGTRWTLNLLPVGGFVELEGEHTPAHAKDTLAARPVGMRVLILLWGIIANILLAWLCFGYFLYSEQKPLSISPRPDLLQGSSIFPSYIEAKELGWLIGTEVHVRAVNAASPYALAGGGSDRVIAMDGVPILSAEQFLQRFRLYAPGQSVRLRVSRWAWESDLVIIPRDGKIGAYVKDVPLFDPNFLYNYSLTDTLVVGANEVVRQGTFAIDVLALTLGNLFTSVEHSASTQGTSVSGPIALTAFISRLVVDGTNASVLLVLAGLVSISLAVFNLLPLPALDGGRVVTTLLRAAVETFAKKSIKSFFHIEHIWHTTWYLILIVLSLLIAYKDIVSLMK